MSQQLQAQANAVLYRALEQPAAERHTFIEQACAGCRELVDLVKAMLSHIDQLDAFLEEPLAVSGAVDEPVTKVLPAAGDLIGRWQVTHPLDRTALGFTMLVESVDETRQQAVLTIVDAAALSLEQLALFHRQCQLLAAFTDPGIARLLDSGLLADGEPFIVIEHVEGKPIDAFCAATGATREARIALLAKASLALHHAHQRLVLHRQLSPGRLLVTAQHELKLVDFDLAGLAEGDATSTVDDISALGAILRKLLLDAGGPLPGALQAIVGRAAGPDARRQYGSGDQLARALQDYLDQAAAPPQPLIAAPAAEEPPRRSVLARAAGACALMLAGAGATLAWQQLQPAAPTAPPAAPAPTRVAAAKPQAADAGALLRQAEARRITGDLAASDAALRQALELTRTGTTPEARARHAAALQAAGTLSIEQGRTADGLAQLRAALAVQEGLAEGLTGEAGNAARLDAAAGRVALAHGLVASGAFAAADAQYSLARAAYAALPSSATRTAIAQLDLARADGQYQRKHWRTAGQTVRALRATLPADADAVLQARAALLEALIQPGGTAAQAYAAAQKALPVLLFDSEADPHNVPKLRDSALAWRRVGEIAARAGKIDAACDNYSLAEKRYAELERAGRLNAPDRKLRAELTVLRAGCR